MLTRPISETLGLLDEARGLWPFEQPPGLGTHPFGERFQLRISDHEVNKRDERRYIIETVDMPGHPLTLSYEWETIRENMRKTSVTTTQEEEIDMAKLSIHDNDLRDKIRLKCKNDWDLSLNEDQISMCIYEMEEQRLSLFHNQIWPNKRRWKKEGQWMERVTWDKSIDGYRAIARRSGRFAGMDAPEFDVDDNDQLIARITVYALDRNGTRCPFVGEARFVEFVQLVDEWENGRKTGKKVPNNQWSDSPHNQLSVAAERQALRKAFQESDDSGFDGDGWAAHHEPDLEQSRGDEVPPPVEEEAPASPPPAKKAQKPKAQKPKAKKPDPKPEPAPAPAAESKGKYVGIPKSGFAAFKMYNADERIVSYVPRKGNHILALDSGKRVTVSGDGHEIERIDRTDTQSKGGRKWSEGDQYYDGAKIEKIASAKKDERGLWLALDNGFKVLLDGWGKEKKKKPRKKSKDKGESTAPKAQTPAPKPQTSQPAPEADAAGKSETVDIESIQSVEKLRSLTIPLLKRWCNNVLKKHVSPKEAYKHFTGVILKKGQAMTLDDFKVLYEDLKEALEDVK